MAGVDVDAVEEYDRDAYDPMTREGVEAYEEVLAEETAVDRISFTRPITNLAAPLGLIPTAATFNAALAATGSPELMVAGGAASGIGAGIAMAGLFRPLKDTFITVDACRGSGKYSVLSGTEAKELVARSGVVNRYVDGELEDTPYTGRAQHAVTDDDVAHRLYRPLQDAAHDYELTLVREESGEQAFEHFFGKVDDPDAYRSEESLASIM